MSRPRSKGAQDDRTARRHGRPSRDRLGRPLPILTLGVGALLLVLFRSLMKQLPKAAADQAVPVIGGLTVIAMWVVGGFAGTDVPLAGLRDDLGDPLFFLGLLIVIGLAGWFAQYLRLSVDAALTVMIGLTSLAATWGVWTDRYEVDGAFGLVGDQLGADGFSLVITGVIAGAIVLVALLSTTTSNVRAWPAPRCTS